MGTPVTFGGTSFTIPALGDSGWAQGPGNLSSYLIAIASGTIQTTGGSFTLSADLNFGSSFGVIAPYYKSASSNIATAGVIRLALGDTIDWGTGNLALSISGSSLQFNGATVVTGMLNLGSQVTGTLPFANGGTGQTTQQAAMDSLAGAVTSGFYLRGNGTHVVMANIQAGDVPTLNQNTTGSSGSCVGNSATATTATGANGINSATTTVVTSGATAPTSGQVLTATSSTAATWQSLPGAASTPTRQVLTSGSSATYTTPANCRQLRIRMVGAGGGGSGNGSSGGAGSNGTSTIFNSIVANPGSGGPTSNSQTGGGAGGFGGTGSASFRIGGGGGSQGTGSGIAGVSGVGGNSAFGGGGNSVIGSSAGASAPNNSGAGGSGAGLGATTVNGNGGGAGEYVELIINSPSSSYLYTIGTGGTGGTGSGLNGGNGGSGIIIVDEYY